MYGDASCMPPTCTRLGAVIPHAVVSAGERSMTKTPGQGSFYAVFVLYGCLRHRDQGISHSFFHHVLPMEAHYDATGEVGSPGDMYTQDIALRGHRILGMRKLRFHLHRMLTEGFRVRPSNSFSGSGSGSWIAL
jgi:hypothetical protein